MSAEPNQPGDVLLYLGLPMLLWMIAVCVVIPFVSRCRQTRKRNRAIAARRRATSTRRTSA